MVARTKLDMELVQREVQQHLQALRSRGFQPPTTPPPVARRNIAPVIEQHPGFAEESHRLLDGKPDT